MSALPPRPEAEREHGDGGEAGSMAKDPERGNEQSVRHMAKLLVIVDTAREEQAFGMSAAWPGDIAPGFSPGVTRAACEGQHVGMRKAGERRRGALVEAIVLVRLCAHPDVREPGREGCRSRSVRRRWASDTAACRAFRGMRRRARRRSARERRAGSRAAAADIGAGRGASAVGRGRLTTIPR